MAPYGGCIGARCQPMPGPRPFIHCALAEIALLRIVHAVAQRDLHSILSHEFTETAPLIRASLVRLDGRSVLIATADGTPLTNGRLVVVEGLDGPLLPSLTMEFEMRSILFTMEVPLERVFTLVATWNGEHFVFRLPRDQRLSVDWPPRVGA